MAKRNRLVKTNAVRILEREEITYTLIEYDISDGQIDGISVAKKTGQSEELVFKTLVTKANGQELFVFLLPVMQELDLKKAARAANVKKLDMLPLKDLLKETGYVRGGCSAVGMKRKSPTFIDDSAKELKEIIISAGKPGVQMKLKPKALQKVTEASFYNLVKS